MRLFRPGLAICYRLTVLPLRHRFRINIISLSQRSLGYAVALKPAPDLIRGTASVVVALPCKIWPIVPPSIRWSN